MATTQELNDVYDRMLDRYGPQHWWPAETQFEVMVGAVLTQATSWTNVEKAISNLKAAGAMTPGALRQLPERRLASLLYSSGYYNAKARKLKALAEFLGQRYSDDPEAMAGQDTEVLRRELLEVHGIGEETADDILLYAAGKTVFVVDAFTKRVMHRLGLAAERGNYSAFQALFIEALPSDPTMFGEYHALLVRHAKDVCKKRPLCRDCCLLDVCPTGRKVVARAPTDT